MPGQRGDPAGHTFSNGYIAILAGLFHGAHAIFPLNRGREGGVKLSCSLPLLTLPLTHSCSGFLWILAQVWFQETFLSHFFAARLITYLEEQLSGKSSILISLTLPEPSCSRSFLFVLVASMKGAGRKISGALKRMTRLGSSRSQGELSSHHSPNLHQHRLQWIMSKTNKKNSSRSKL